MKRIIYALIALVVIVFVTVACVSGRKSSLRGVWKIESVSGLDIVPVDDVPTIRFTPRGTYQINTGLNILNGKYVLKDGVLEMKDGLMTQKLGSDESMVIEDAIVNAVRQKLELSFSDGKAILVNSGTDTCISLVR